jgi:hypothetical protein
MRVEGNVELFIVYYCGIIYEVGNKSLVLMKECSFLLIDVRKR